MKVTRFLLLLVVVLFGLTSCLPSVYDAPYPIEAIDLSRDDAAHDAPIEWWYYTGHLEDEAGESYGFELTFFKLFTPPRYQLFGFLPAYWFVDRGYVGHVAISKTSTETFSKAEQLSFGGGAEASNEKLYIRINDWSAEILESGEHQIIANTDDFRFNLVLDAQKPAALHGNPPGIQSMGPGGTSYYLSYTRMSAEGSLNFGCNSGDCPTLTVTGQAWHDHQWGDFSMEGYAGWDWFSMQFDNNTELMLYLIREPSGVYSAAGGSYIDRAGRVTELSIDDFQVTETGKTWESEDTGAIYPMSWAVTVPSLNISLEVEPTFFEQEMNTRATTGIVYWEGTVNITGSYDGVGFVELTNYDLYPYGQTDENTPLKPLTGPISR